MTDKLTDLLQQIEQQGFADAHGHLLTNCRQWHQLRLAARLIEERTGPAVGGAVERAVQDAVEGAKL